MKLAYTLHSVVHKGETHDPGKVIELDADTYAELERMRAVREPSEQEKALHGMTTRKPAAAAPAPASKADPEREALEARAEKLGVKFNKNLSTSKLRERVEEAEKAAEPTTNPASESTDEDPDVIG